MAGGKGIPRNSPTASFSISLCAESELSIKEINDQQYLPGSHLALGPFYTPHILEPLDHTPRTLDRANSTCSHT